MKIVLYTTGCPRCDILHAKLKQAAVTYETVTDVSIMAEKGFFYLPILEVDDEAMEFGDAVKWLKEYPYGN